MIKIFMSDLVHMYERIMHIYLYMYEQADTCVTYVHTYKLRHEITCFWQLLPKFHISRPTAEQPLCLNHRIIVKSL